MKKDKEVSEAARKMAKGRWKNTTKKERALHMKKMTDARLDKMAKKKADAVQKSPLA